jgi:hypothetical protein
VRDFVRPTLPWLVAVVWLWLTWFYFLDAPELRDVPEAVRDARDQNRWNELGIAAWFVGLFPTMLLVDQLRSRWWRRQRGGLAHIHWTRLRNSNGDFICAGCESIFMVAPANLQDGEMVTCGDCGLAKAPYGEMKLYLDPEGRFRQMQRALLR